MIAKSDLVILLVSLTVLGGGIYRWQGNTGTVPAVTVPASLQSSVQSTTSREPEVPVTGRIAPQTSSTRVVSDIDAPTNIVVNGVNDDTDVVVPTVQANTGDTTNNDAVSSEPLYGVHNVVSGDYLGKIAARYGTSVTALREANNLSGSDIFVGQQLRYPLPAN